MRGALVHNPCVILCVRCCQLRSRLLSGDSVVIASTCFLFVGDLVGGCFGSQEGRNPLMLAVLLCRVLGREGYYGSLVKRGARANAALCNHCFE